MILRLAHLLCSCHHRADLWQEPSPVPGATLGDLLLEQRSFAHSKVWIWAGFAFIVGAIIITNLAVMACLSWLKGEHTGSSNSPFLHL